jgi:hypothetical protein
MSLFYHGKNLVFICYPRRDNMVAPLALRLLKLFIVMSSENPRLSFISPPSPLLPPFSRPSMLSSRGSVHLIPAQGMVCLFPKVNGVPTAPQLRPITMHRLQVADKNNCCPPSPFPPRPPNPFSALLSRWPQTFLWRPLYSVLHPLPVPEEACWLL